MNTRTVRRSQHWARHITLRQLARLPARRTPLTAVDALASFLWKRSPIVRRGLLLNQAQVLQASPRDPAVLHAARTAHGHLLRNYIDLFHAAALPAAALRDHIRLTNGAGLQRVLDEFGACILLSGHFAGGEMAMQALAAAGRPLTVAAEHTRPEWLYRSLCRVRAAHGNRFVPSDGSLTALVRPLRVGGVLALAMDRDTTGSGSLVPCCNALARLPAGAVRLSRRYHVPLVPVTTGREADGRVYAHIEEPLPWTIERKTAISADQGLASLAAVLERMIKHCPEQWVLTTPLWATRHAHCV